MGQRHQVFICLENKDNSNKVPQIAAFGDGERTVYAYHNQNLYGVSAIKNCLKVLEFAKASSTDAPDYYNIFRKAERTLWNNERTANALANFMGFDAEYGRYNSFSLMNDPQNDYENYMREEFDRGDNNDGVTIIDTINMKYCFMRVDGISGTLEKFKNYTPISAEDYVRAYYPIGTTEWADKEIPKVLKKYKKSKLMSKDEVANWFPKMRSKVFGVDATEALRSSI